MCDALGRFLSEVGIAQSTKINSKRLQHVWQEGKKGLANWQGERASLSVRRSNKPIQTFEFISHFGQHVEVMTNGAQTLYLLWSVAVCALQYIAHHKLLGALHKVFVGELLFLLIFGVVEFAGIIVRTLVESLYSSSFILSSRSI